MMEVVVVVVVVVVIILMMEVVVRQFDRVLTSGTAPASVWKD